MNIVIFGTGIEGLSAAIALKQEGYTVDIFERSHYRTDADIV